jgi:hypothetical protein
MAQLRKFAAKVSQTGELQIAEPLVWRAYLARLRGQVVYVVLEKLRQTRTAQQNRRYWGMLVPLASEILSLPLDLPLSNEQTHEVLKGAFIGHLDTALGKAPKSSRSLNIEEYMAYCNRIEQWLLHDHGVVVPSAGESLEEYVR